MTNGQTKYGGQVLPTRSTTKDGNAIYLEMTLAILRDDAGQVLGALAIIRDITERRAQERELRERMVQLERQVAGDAEARPAT